MANEWFRLIGAIGRNTTIANTFAFGVLLLIIGVGGFIVSKGNSLEMINLIREIKTMILCVIVVNLIKL